MQINSTKKFTKIVYKRRY